MKPPVHYLARLAVLLIPCFSVAVRAQTNVAFLVLPEFANVLTNSPAINSTNQNSLALYSGTLGAYRPPGSGLPLSVPSSAEGLQLAGCGFGQMLARSVPFPDFELETIKIAREMLYPPATATTREQIAASGAAFRYRELLYTNDGTSVRAEYEEIVTYFSEAERQKAREGIAILRQALKYSPLHRQLRNTLLDAYYDFIVAEVQYVKSDLVEVAKYRLGLAGIPDDDFIIDYEIAGYTNILKQYAGILGEYGKLFLDHGGIDVSQVDSNAPPGIILGQWIFQQAQPERDQLAAQFREANGILTTVPLLGATNATLFHGYKDYVALLVVMRDYAQSAAELAKLYGLRARAAPAGQKDDKTLGFELIDGINREILLNTSLLHALLPDAIPPASEPDPSGIRAAIAGVQAGTAELTKVGGFLSSQVNILGFDPDFLALVSTFVNADSEHLWDSYDALRGWLEHPNSTNSILGRVRHAFTAAHDAYHSYRGYADEVFDEMSHNEESYAQRYWEICGYLPDELPDPYPSPVPAGHYPPVNTNVPPSHANNPRAGSELRQVHQSIEQSNAKAISLTNASSSLNQQLRLAHDRLESSTTRSNAIINATKAYGNIITTERNTITHWNATQAGAQAAYEMVADVASIGAGVIKDPFGVGHGPLGAVEVYAAGAANIAIQTVGERKKGNAERNLDLAAADFDKDLALAEADQNIFQAGEEVRNLEREKQSQVLTLQDNSFIRDQDMERMDGLQREMQQVRALWDQNNPGLASRYYADPIHFLRAQNNMIRADFAFRPAQRWVFLVLRALEYKYNQPFVYRAGAGSTRWELSSLFKLRHAQELDDFLSALHQFNGANVSKLDGRSIVTDRISLKEDVWGRTYTNQLDRLAEFRKQIAASYDAPSGTFKISLNTLRLSEELENGALFIGAQYGADGGVVSKGRYLDKIEYIKVKFVDSTVPSPVTKPGSLSYSGTCFVRTEKPSCIGGGLQLTNELRSFPFRYYFMGTDPDTGLLEADGSAEQSADLDVVFWNQPDKAIEPTDPLNPAAYQSTFLRERSVAITNLKLTLLASKVNTNTLQDVHIYIRHLYALRTECQ